MLTAVANRIRALREQRDKLIPGEYTQAALARRLGIAANTLRAWELDRARPRKAAAKRLARALGVSVADLGLEEPVPRHPAPEGSGDEPVSQDHAISEPRP